LDDRNSFNDNKKARIQQFHRKGGRRKKKRTFTSTNRGNPLDLSEMKKKKAIHQGEIGRKSKNGPTEQHQKTKPAPSHPQKSPGYQQISREKKTGNKSNGVKNSYQFLDWWEEWFAKGSWGGEAP